MGFCWWWAVPGIEFVAAGRNWMRFELCVGTIGAAVPCLMENMPVFHLLHAWPFRVPVALDCVTGTRERQYHIDRWLRLNPIAPDHDFLAAPVGLWASVSDGDRLGVPIPSSLGLRTPKSTGDASDPLAMLVSTSSLLSLPPPPLSLSFWGALGLSPQFHFPCYSPTSTT
jgi:hypothetical protein